MIGDDFNTPRPLQPAGRADAAVGAAQEARQTDLTTLREIATKVLWLSTAIVDAANNG